ncbi:hypothetical protein [Corynebacterium falsenii]|uniref:hypothetical protein n=1 Tax=Corynebacterium falsenii TaxID=108486 RepID=UPI001D351148|nr:hypothetical protein [Corynebacterium falsenii]HJF11818.1 hypothetical protein [Corynebacterium falsenii]
MAPKPSPWARTRSTISHASSQVRSVRHWPLAGAIALGLCATWLIPQGVSAMVGTHEKTTGANDTVTIAAADSTVSFTAPEGWTFPTSRKASAATFTKGDRTVSVELVGGVTDASAAQQRRKAALERDGISASFTDQTRRGGAGFTGKGCIAVKPTANTVGDCAVVTSGSQVVSIVSLGPNQASAYDIQPLLDSLHTGTTNTQNDSRPSGNQEAK